MKKLIVSFGIMALVSGASFAYFDETKTSDIDVLRKQGYSETTLQVVDWANATNKGDGSTYVRQFTPKSHNGIGKAYTRLKTYFDPIQDDGQFGEHQVQFTNTWRQGEGLPQYSTEVVEKNSIENL